MEVPDFSGYATKANLRCSDGRIIAPEAFQHQDKMKVPLVWQHMRDDVDNILGHAILENRSDGVYCYAYFNDTEKGRNAKIAVEHQDVNALSIFANKLVEKAKTVTHGMIREVSLVMAGANPGALIDFINVEHADGSLGQLQDEAIIYTGLEIEHANKVEENSVTDETTEEVEHAEERTIGEILGTLTEEQQNVVAYLVGEAMNGTAEHSDLPIAAALESMTDEQKNAVTFVIGKAIEHSAENSSSTDDSTDDDNSASHSDNQEGNLTMSNVFESNGAAGTVKTGSTLSHEDSAKIFQRAKRLGSLREAVEEYAGDSLEHGIDDIDILFPDARNVTGTPEFVKRRTEWVDAVLSGTHHTPFSRIKTMTADLTFEEARAKGYIKGNLKKEEFFRVAKRVTTPQTIYKKQKLDRDDILDITDFDVVAWLKGEMRLMLEEEIARAVLVGDGRSGGDEDKINETNVRPIASDEDLFVTYLRVNLGDASSSDDEVIDSFVLNRRFYRGSGNPTLFCGETLIARLLSIKDTQKRRIYSTMNDLLAILRVKEIVPVEIMDSPSSPALAIMVNLQDYTIGSDKGGDVTLFEDFDIDYNQEKYLIETRISGALTKAKAALVMKQVASSDTLVDPVAPSWNSTTHQLTVATTTGITYKNRDTGGTLTTGSPVTLSPGDELVVKANANSGYYLSTTAADEFRFTYEDGRADDAF